MRIYLTAIAIVVLIFVALALNGCTGIDSAKSEIVSRAAEFSDNAAEDAEFIICRAITVGTWQRKYGTNAERAAAWRALCSKPILTNP